MLDLEPYLDRKPKDLSGGQRQRVAMGRAIVRRPQVFLMDEPLSNLDAKLRVQTRNQIAALQRRLGTTTVYVTHDQVEAMTMGDRVAVLSDGVLQQCAAAARALPRPRQRVRRRVHRLTGDEPVHPADRRWLGCAGRLGYSGAPRNRRPAMKSSSASAPSTSSWAATSASKFEVDMVEELGADAYLYGRIIDIPTPVTARADGLDPPERGSRVRLRANLKRVHFFGADGRRIG